MIYVDDYNSKVINNSPPKKEDREALAKTRVEMNAKQLVAFWYISGVTIASNYPAVKELLLKYGYDASNEQDAASAIANMYGTPKWTKFVVEFGDLIESTVDDNLIEKLSDGNEESSFVAALITAIGGIASSSLGLASSSKAKKAAETNAKSAMFAGITNVLAEKEKLKAEKEKTLRESKSGIVWIVIAVLVVIGIIIGIVVYKKNKAKNAVA